MVFPGKKNRGSKAILCNSIKGQSNWIYRILVPPDVVDRLKSVTSIVEEKGETKMKHEENIIPEEIFRGRVQEELKIQEMKLHIKSKEYEKRDKIVNERRINVKLPKLVIRKFDGASLDWYHFWNQFEIEIDKLEIGPVSKFSYLKDLLIPRVKLHIDGLPFTSEGYSRAKSISLVSQLKLLMAIFNVLPRCLLFKIHIQTEYMIFMKLVINVQALDAMNKLK